MAGHVGIHWHVGGVQAHADQHLVARVEAMTRGTRRGFGDLLDDVAEAMTIRDRTNAIIYANRAALRLMGLASLQELQARTPSAVMGDYVVTDEHGRELTIHDLPSVRLLRGESVDPLLLRAVHRRTGRTQWSWLKATGLHDEQGELVATATIIRDVTSEKVAELRRRFLAEAARRLAGAPDCAAALRAVAAAAVPQIADWCAIDVLDGHGRLQRVVAAHRDPEMRKLAERLHACAPKRLDPDRGAGRVVSTGVPELRSEIADELLGAAATDDAHHLLMRATRMRSLVIVAMQTPRGTVGTLMFGSAESGRRFDADDMRFAEEIADRAALAVERAKLYDGRVGAAVTLHRSRPSGPVSSVADGEIADGCLGRRQRRGRRARRRLP